MSFLRRLSIATAATTAGLYTITTNVDLYNGPIGNYLHRLDPERAHNLTLKLASYYPTYPPFLPRRNDPKILYSTVWGIPFSNPIGLAAGFDKNAQAMTALFSIGFGFVEIGSVTPKPQFGNPLPRVFRLKQDAAIINRYGFNSDGIQKVSQRIYQYDHGGRFQHLMGVLGVNLGKNKDTLQKDAVNDYLIGLNKLGDLAEYIVINVSSPNTPGLRNLQATQQLKQLLLPIMKARDELIYRPPILVKIAPDLSDLQLQEICQVALQVEIDGIIVSNTTIDKNGLISKHKDEIGGLSGRPLKKKSTYILSKVYQYTDGKIPLIGVGGIENGNDAYEKIKAGASLVQLYTALVYQGPWLVWRIKKQLAQLLERDGYESIADAVGADHRIGQVETVNETV